MYNIDTILPIFVRVQKSEIFPDQKTMADAVPKISPEEIMEKYDLEQEKEGFNLKDFVEQNFHIPKEEANTEKSEAQLPILEHIENLWAKLQRESVEDYGALMKLPKPYIVPGGRFSEFFYWDSYFVMLGLQAGKKHELIRNIVENCAYLINELGYVPNGNRTYFLGRSQPPFFSMMVELLAEIDGDGIYEKYHGELLKEYDFWMKGQAELNPNNAHVARTVLMKDGEVLNRYYDGYNFPRYESYLIDVKDFKRGANSDFFSNIRSACESGWDFSSRWFADWDDISTIETNDIVPIDLNCLLYHLEKTIAKTFELKKDDAEHKNYIQKAKTRKIAIQKYFWNDAEQYYFDYHCKKRDTKKFYHIASVFPLFFKISETEQALNVAERFKKLFLKNGGVLNTAYLSGQQWDAPNGWAPNQWISYVAMKNYNQDEIANQIKENWCNNVERVYKNTGKLMEKYNVEDTELLAGGGEYPNQDGFGWTNGVYLKLKNSN